MKKLILAALLLSLPSFPASNASHKPPTRADFYKGKVLSYIGAFNPRIPEVRQHSLARNIARAADTFDIDPKILTYILIQESGLRGGLKSREGDYGIAQVNCKVWCVPLGLDKERLRYDDEYGIVTAAMILAELKREYGGEKRWWSRYHNFIPKYRVAYEKLVNSRMAKG